MLRSSSKSLESQRFHSGDNKYWISLQSDQSLRGPHMLTRSTQPCIHPGSLNRVPASAGVRAGMSPLLGGR